MTPRSCTQNCAAPGMVKAGSKSHCSTPEAPAVHAGRAAPAAAPTQSMQQTASSRGVERLCGDAMTAASPVIAHSSVRTQRSHGKPSLGREPGEAAHGVCGGCCGRAGGWGEGLCRDRCCGRVPDLCQQHKFRCSRMWVWVPRRATPDTAAKFSHHEMRSSGCEHVRVLSRDNSDSALERGRVSAGDKPGYVEPIRCMRLSPVPAVGGQQRLWQLRGTGA